MHPITNLFLVLLCLGGSFTGYSQTVVFNTDQSIPVFRYTDYLINSWTGGFNAPQFSTMDLNGDSADDLVIFDRTSNRLYTFEASTMAGNPVYRHIPKYESMFPALESWVLLVDYDGDGRKDIFAHANLGVMVYRNITTSDTLKWQLMADPLYQQYSNNPAPNNIYVNITDIPAITDIDYDGDYDILNYNFFNGANIEFHKNLSVETYGHNDSLNFKAIDDCYGGIIETSCNYSFGGSCPVTRMGQITHVGAASLLIIDENGDGDKDIFSGKEDCVDLFELPNTGSAGSPAFSSVHTYPQNTSAIRFPGMPGLYFEDLDFDGIKDILASPSMFTNSALGVNDTIDFQHSCHFYKNTGSNNAPVLSHQQDDFLQNTMVDVGENAAPAFADYDADGDLDMFAGNRGLYYGPGFSASINLFLNTGTNSNPSYTLINEDYLNFSTLGFTYIRPAFTDINGDNSTDLVFAAYNSSSAYTIQYIPNTNAAGTPYAYNPASMTTLPVSPGHEDSPCFYDVDGDLDLDILMARANGNLAYFENTGSNASPSYTQVTNTFGGITVDGPHNRIYLTLTVMDADADGNPDLVTADNTGRLRYYSDFLSNINGTFTPIDIQVDSSLTYNLGKILYLTNADLNNDGKKELIIGSNTGGLICLNTSATHINVSAITKSSLLLEDIMLFPNPANQDLTISAPYQGHFSLIDIYGRTVKDEQSFVKNTPQSVSLDDLPSGIYFLRFETDDHRSAMKKIVVQK